MTRGRAITKVAVGTAVGALCLWAALHDVEWANVQAALERFDLRWLLPAFAVSAAIQLLRAWRWQIELTPLACLPYWLLWRVISVAFMMINVLPFRLGEPVRPLLLSWKTGLPISSIVGNWVFEKMMDTAVIVLVVHFTLVAANLGPWAHYTSMTSLLFFVTMLVLVIGFWLHGEGFYERTIARVLPEHTAGKLRHMLQHARRGLEILPDKRLVAMVFLVSLGLAALPILSCWLLIRGFGFDIPATACFVVYIYIGIGMVLPNPPGMVGVFQIASLHALGLYGVPQSDAVAYGIVLNAVQLVSLVVQGVIAMPWIGVGLKTITRAAVESPAADRCQAAPG